jgi:hypothetical protein
MNGIPNVHIPRGLGGGGPFYSLFLLPVFMYSGTYSNSLSNNQGVLSREVEYLLYSLTSPSISTCPMASRIFLLENSSLLSLVIAAPGRRHLL